MATAALERADQFAGDVVVSTTDAAGTIGKIGFDFGFRATYLRIWNDKATDVYVNLDSTTGSTGGFRLRACSDFMHNLLIGGCALASTATSTADKVRLVALRA